MFVTSLVKLPFKLPSSHTCQRFGGENVICNVWLPLHLSSVPMLVKTQLDPHESGVNALLKTDMSVVAVHRKDVDSAYVEQT